MSQPLDTFYQRAFAAAQDYVSANTGYTLSAEPAFEQGQSHRVVRAMRDKQPVVIKFYAHGNAACKENEIAALTHFAATNLVPQIIDGTPDRLLVMSEVPGLSLARFAHDRAGSETYSASAEIFTEIGRALGQLVRVPFPQTVKARSELERRWQSFLSASWRVYEREPTYHTPFFHRSLGLQEEQSETTLTQPLCLVNYDTNPGNIIVQEGHFQGFVDLEACQSGTQMMQLGTALFTVATYPNEKAAPPLLWKALLHGYESETGRRLNRAALTSCLAMAHFKYWTFLHRYGGYADWNAERPKWFVLPDAAQVQCVLALCENLVKETAAAGRD